MNLKALYIAVLAILVAVFIYCTGHNAKHHKMHHVDHNELKIKDAYARAASPTAKAGAIFFVIENGTDEMVHLIGAKTDVANRVELHTHTENAEGVMEMREVEGGIKAEAKHKVKLKRGGLHVMLMGLNTSLVSGETVPLELTFADRTIKLDVTVDNERKAKSHGDHDHEHH